VAAIQRYAKAHAQPVERVLLRLDGQYGTGAILAERAGLAYVMRGKDSQLLDRKARPGTLTPACRSAVQPPGKSPRAHPLRLP
jgi:hypothetical protein